MGGTITLSSEKDVGTVFEVRLPLRLPTGGSGSYAPVAKLRGVVVAADLEGAPDDLCRRALRDAVAYAEAAGAELVPLGDPRARITLVHAGGAAAGTPVLVIGAGVRGPLHALGGGSFALDAVRREPLVRAIEELVRPRATAAAVRGPQPSLRGRVLVAEDDALVQGVLRRQLRQVGVSATFAENGATALGLWAGGAFDLLLTDLHMPGMDGLALAREARRALARPVVLFTADVLVTEEELAGVVDAVLTKPCGLDALQDVLTRLLPPAETLPQVRV